MFRTQAERDLDAFYSQRGGKTFPCEGEVCRRRFLTQAGAKQHQTSCHDELAAPAIYACPMEGCGSVLRAKSSLRRHLNTLHGVRPRGVTDSPSPPTTSRIFAHEEL